MVLEVAQESVLVQQVFLLHISELLFMLKMYDYDDNSTLVSVVPSPLDRVRVAESLNRDLNRVSGRFHL